MTKRLTDEELAQIRERSEMASAGPWTLEGVAYESFAVMSPDYLYGEMFVVSVKDDADFIANAREDIPKLLAEIEMLRDEVELYEEIVDSKDEQLGDIREILAEAIE